MHFLFYLKYFIIKESEKRKFLRNHFTNTNFNSDMNYGQIIIIHHNLSKISLFIIKKASILQFG